MTMRTQFTTRLPEPLASALADQAQANHRSANAELTSILRNALSGTQFERATTLQTVNVGYAAHTAQISGAPSTSDLAPYKAALQRLIDDSAALREKYEDLDAAVEQARVLL
jgi:plasmid stability protein